MTEHTPAAGANTLWRIVFGDYDFALDRRALTFSLTDTKTGVVWAEHLAVGWVELADRDTGERTRYGFGDAKLVSLSEKSGPQGKRILLGLDLRGIPLDVYVICAQREIQWIVEATRDSPTHTVEDFGLLPGVVSVPDDGASYLVIPHRDGRMLFARDAPTNPQSLRIWDSWFGVTMPFVGAVRCGDGDVRNARASLALLTDSAYGRFMLSRKGDAVCLDTEYSRDPERRRLDIRLVVLPGENHVAAARAYRDKIIGEKNHVTLRKKIRDRPSVDKLIGAAFVHANKQGRENIDALRVDFGEPIYLQSDQSSLPEEPILLTLALHPLVDHPTRWDDMEERLQSFAQARERRAFVGTLSGCDWPLIAADYVTQSLNRGPRTRPLPLFAVVYHDSVALVSALVKHWMPRFLRLLLHLALPSFLLNRNEAQTRCGEIHRIMTVLCPLHRLTFPAFLTSHRFLTADLHVEEAIYSDKTRIVINQSETDDWHDDTLHLPPLGFYVRHPRMEAHNALRVGAESFEARGWRVARSRDGLPLEMSEDIAREVFAV